MIQSNVELFLKQAADIMGAEFVNRSDETLKRYGENTLPAGDKPPFAVVYPGTTAEIQSLVRLARTCHTPLYPISTGNNIGMGSRSAVFAGQVILDLGLRMNRIIDVNEDLGYAVVEPGVTYQALHDELVRRGNRLMLDVTSGPPQGGIIGNALEKGAGYTPYFDHFGSICGMEVVLGSGELLRTGDGVINGDNLLNWHTSKYSFGPILDGLFAQSNYGIVSKAGIWLMPRPPAIVSFHFAFPEDDDLAEVIDLCRPLKLSNFVPTLLRVANDLYLCAPEGESPEYRTSNGKRAISDRGRGALREHHGVGSWNVSGALYGASAAALEPAVSRIREHFLRSGKAKYISHEEGLERSPYKIAIDTFSGTPGVGELGMLKWRPGGGNSWFLPGTPMQGHVANDLQKVCRQIYEEEGLDYTVMNVCGARFARGLHVITYNREDTDERQRADACYRRMSAEAVKRGIFVGRAPLDYFEFHMRQAMPSFRAVCSQIKKVLDPDGIISPGRYIGNQGK